MKTPGNRLREARKAAGFSSASQAAKRLSIPVSTYNSHERAGEPGGREFGPREAAQYARAFKCDDAWLLTGRGRGSAHQQSDHIESDAVLMDNSIGHSSDGIPIVGYVGAGAKTHFYEIGQGQFDCVAAPQGSSEKTVAVEIRGNCLGSTFNRWVAFYDDIRSPITSDMLGQLCVVWTDDGQVLIKTIRQSNGGYDLHSENEPPIIGVKIKWAACVKSLARK